MFLFKVLRLKKGAATFDSKRIKKILQVWQKEKMKKLENDEKLCNDKLREHHNTSRILITSYLNKVLQLFMLILSASFFFAVTFKIVCDLEADFNNIEIFSENPDYSSFEDQSNYFLLKY